jgi:hypothetical protein
MGLVIFALAHDLITSHSEGNITIQQIATLTNLSYGTTYDLLEALYEIHGFGDAISISQRIYVLLWNILIAENLHLFKVCTPALLSNSLLPGFFLCPKRFHQLRMLGIVLNGSPNLTAIKIELGGHIFNRPLSLSYESADLKHADARPFNSGLPVKHVRRFHDANRGTHFTLY